MDAIRLLACFMIVVMHSPLPSENASGIFLSSLSYLTAPGIGLFFMISGALLLPVRQDIGTFFRRRFSKMAFPVLFWSFFYLLIDGSVSWKSVLSIPFSAQGNPVFWFIYTLLGLYLLAPILSRWITNASQRELEFYLGLWALSLCYPFLKLIVNVNQGDTGILYYFSGYGGYFLLGYYLRKYPDSISFGMSALLMLIALLVPTLCKVSGVQTNFYEMFWYLSVFVMLQCVFWWKLMKKLSAYMEGTRFCPSIIRLSELTFGIYLIHIFIMRNLLWHWDWILSIALYPLQTFVIILLTFFFSAVCTFLIGLLPRIRHVVGLGRGASSDKSISLTSEAREP